jgi:hypothetical protein
MGHLTIALATLGFSVGVVFRLKVLLLVLAVLLVGSIGFSLARNFTVPNTALTIITTQGTVQSSYFWECWHELPLPQSIKSSSGVGRL